MKQGWIRLLFVSLMVNWLALAGLPAVVLADGPGVSMPKINVPTVRVPEIDGVSTLPDPHSVPAETAQAKPAKAKELVQKITKTAIGTRNVLDKAAAGMDHQGRIPGLAGYIRQYLVQLALPWADVLAIPQIDSAAKGGELIGKTKELQKFLETYQSLKAMAKMENGGLRALGPNFSILGGTAGIIYGGYEIVSGLNENSSASEADKTITFLAGVADLVSGLGTVAGGISTLIAGTAAAPALAVAGTILFAAGILIGALAYGFQFAPWFRNSPLGRGLSRFRKQLAGLFSR
jgi:hypothetical protein